MPALWKIIKGNSYATSEHEKRQAFSCLLFTGT